jgi:hypothetical protein
LIRRLAILITSNITAEVLSVDIYREETERRWQIPRIKRKQIYEIYKERRRII